MTRIMRGKNIPANRNKQKRNLEEKDVCDNHTHPFLCKKMFEKDLFRKGEEVWKMC